MGRRGGELGPIYGAQWRWPPPDGGHVDQIAEVEKLLREDPDSRRIIVSAWNVADLPRCGCRRATRSSSSTSGRSAARLPALPALRRLRPRRPVQHRELRATDPHDRAAVRPRARDLVYTGGDCHIYVNHRERVKTLLSRDPFPYPTLKLLRRPESIFDYAFEDFEVVGVRAPPGAPRAGRRLKRSPPARVRGGNHVSPRAPFFSRAWGTSRFPTPLPTHVSTSVDT